MRRKHAQVRDQEPLPAMLAGDDGTAPPAPAALVSPQEREIAALLPDDLRVVIEGSSTTRLLLIAAGLLGGLTLELYAMGGMYNLEGQVLLIGGPWAFVAWLIHRDLVRRRREFRLADGGITVEVRPLAGGPPRVTHIRWTEIADYTVSVDYEKAYLRVVSAGGYTLTLDDRPPRLSTRELIRRFVEQADRHPRAAEPKPRRKGVPLPDVTGERPPILAGCLTVFAFIMVSSAVETFLEPSFAQEMAGIAVLSAILLGVHMWWTLDDSDVAVADRDARSLIARLRRWLRRVLRVRVS
ncbi:MAG TPA: hypothetical protein VHG08_28490 [Longimicrobium sp.]|nr:hypothetical protein [Longimicrobium sp.]